MKKLLLLVAAVAAFSTATAQKGTFALGGTVGFNTAKDAGSNFTIAPSVDYFVSNKISIGLNLAYSNLKPEGKDAINTFGVGVGATYYVTLADNFYYTPGLGVGITTQKDVDTGFGINLQAVAFEFRPTKKIGIMFGCGGIEYMSQGNSSAFGINLNVAPTIGFRYFF